MFSCDVAVIGAGPYGLAAAAHLRARRLETVVFGRTMSFWKRHMPKGMLLRSPWTGSHIGDPSHELTIDHFAAADGMPRQEPIPLGFFIRYGEWFQKAAVPDVDRRLVIRIDWSTAGFKLLLEDGDILSARNVVVATGLAGHEHRPAQFVGLPKALVTHSSEHESLSRFAGKQVAVVGAGQSALESAALLLETGAEVDLIARTNEIHWIGRGKVQGLTDRLSPPAQIGPFPLNWLIEQPDVVRYLPAALKKRIAARGLRPSAAGWLFDRTGQLRMRTARVVISAGETREQVLLKLDDRSQLLVDHVLLATGYRPSLTKYPFLPPELIFRMASADRYPVLSGSLESSMPGLYFAGAAAVPSLGPYMRFVAGSGFAGRRLARHIAEQVRSETPSATRIFASPGVSASKRTVAEEHPVAPLTSLPAAVIEKVNDRL